MALIRQTQTDDGGINVIVGERYGAFFPNECRAQVDFLFEAVAAGGAVEVADDNND